MRTAILRAPSFVACRGFAVLLSSRRKWAATTGKKTAQQSVIYSRNHVFEPAAVQDERAILQAAMERSMGQATSGQVRREFEQRAQPLGAETDLPLS